MSKAEPIRDDAQLTEPEPAARDSFGAAFERLVGIMARLRGPGGCPWDREQDLHSLRKYLIEESYEVIEAIEEGSVADHREELGDLLLQVVFQSEIRRQAGEFDAADVTHEIADKLVRRHPHVFGELEAEGGEAAYRHWEQIKAKEKEGRSVIAGVPRQLPALLRAQRITEKASRVGFDWNDIEGPLDKLREELAELSEAVRHQDRSAIEHELGDVLFTIVNVARFLDVGAEEALSGTVDRFSRRFVHVETSVKDEGLDLRDLSIEELERRWQLAKVALEGPRT